MEHYIWTYLISGANKAYQLLSQNPNDSTDSGVKKAREGIQLIILLGLASSIEGFIRKILIDFNTNENRACFSFKRKDKKPIQEQSWNELKETFNNLCPTKLSKVLKRTDKNLNEGLDILFAYRNFIAHSKHINVTDEYEVELRGITKYFEKHNLTIRAEYFIDRIIGDTIIEHFKHLAMKVFEINFHKYFQVSRLVDNFIDENDYSTNEYHSLIYNPH